MREKRPDLYFFAIVVLGTVFLVGMGYFHLNYLQEMDVGENFRLPWQSANLFLEQRLSPYSQESQEIVQNTVYGRLARGWEDAFIFSQPFFMLILFFPFTITNDFSLALMSWFVINLVFITIAMGLPLVYHRWNLNWKMGLVYLLFAIGPAPVWIAVLEGSIVPLVSLFLGIMFYAVYRRADLLAGVMLAFALIEPNMVLLLVPMVILWAISQKRHQIWIAFFTAWGVLLLGAWFFERHSNIDFLVRWISETWMGSELDSAKEMFLHIWPDAGVAVYWLWLGFLSILLLRSWFQLWGKGERWFYWTAALTLIISLLIGIPSSYSYQIILIPSLVAVFSTWNKRWDASGGAMIGIAIILFLGLSWWSVFPQLNSLSFQGQTQSTYFWLPLFSFVLLLWSRFWVLKSEHLSGNGYQNVFKEY